MSGAGQLYPGAHPYGSMHGQGQGGGQSGRSHHAMPGSEGFTVHNPYAQPSTNAGPATQPRPAVQEGALPNPYAQPATNYAPLQQPQPHLYYPPGHTAPGPAPAPAPTAAQSATLYPPILHAPPPPSGSSGVPAAPSQHFNRCGSARGFPDQQQVETYQLPPHTAQAPPHAATAPAPTHSATGAAPQRAGYQSMPVGYPEQLQVETYSLPTHASSASCGSNLPPPAPHLRNSAPIAPSGAAPGLQPFPDDLQIDTYNMSTLGFDTAASGTSAPGTYNYSPQPPPPPAPAQQQPKPGAAKVHAAQEPRDALIDELSDLALQQPPQPFADRYLLLDERVEAGQSVVNFARDSGHSQQQYAIKFFDSLADMEEETALYKDAVLRAVLPQLLAAHPNTDGRLRSSSGYQWPPHIVLERGLPLRQWAKRRRSYFEVCGMLDGLVTLVKQLHDGGKVHRDLKPDNALFLLNSASWCLLDLGIVARAGESAWPACSPLYAPPEVLQEAYNETVPKAQRRVVVQPSHDIWSLGVIAYEALTGGATFKTMAEVQDCADGSQQYPWEQPQEAQPEAWRTSKLRRLVARCLHRDPARRVTAEQLCADLARMGMSTTVLSE